MLNDQQSHDVLKQVAEGRTPREMQALMAVAHQEVTLGCEREKHGALMAKRRVSIAKGVTLQSHGQVTFESDEWDDLIAFLGDDQGVHHIPVPLGMAWAALLNRDQAELECQLYLLFKAASRTFPHVRQSIESAESQLHAPAKPEPQP